MKKLESIIQYECTTSVKYVWLFYIIQYLIIIFITLIIGFIRGTFADFEVNGLELNTLVYVAVLGVLGFKDDFKMLIQNGFTRKYIFIATIVMFSFISGIMALIATIVGNGIHYFNSSNSTFYGIIYGYDHLFMNWLWLALLYFTVCCLAYLVVLTINKIGKKSSILLLVILSGIILLIIALFRYVFTRETIYHIFKFIVRVMGFMADGTVNYVFPVITFLILASFLSTGSYAIIRRTELK